MKIIKKLLGIGLVVLVILIVIANVKKAVGPGVDGGDAGSGENPSVVYEPPAKGEFLREVPPEMDVVFSSSRFMLDEAACLDEKGKRLARPIVDPECNPAIYAARQQVYLMDVDHPDCKKENCPVAQLTNLDCYIGGGSLNNGRNKLLINAACDDSSGDGKIYMEDDTDLYVVDLPTGEMFNLSKRVGGLSSENNHSFSPVEDKILVSARKPGGWDIHLWTVRADGSGLTRLTNDSRYSEFDAAFSADGTKIVMVRITEITHPITEISQIWMMNADGTGFKKLTEGGENPKNEPNAREFPIGTDTDPDFSPDGKQVVFDRLVTGGNAGIGIWYMYLVDVDNPGELTQITSKESRDLIPSWGEKGILFTRQTLTGKDPMKMRQETVLWKDGKEMVLEDKLNGLFPIGGNSVAWL